MINLEQCQKFIYGEIEILQKKVISQNQHKTYATRGLDENNISALYTYLMEQISSDRPLSFVGRKTAISIALNDWPLDYFSNIERDLFSFGQRLEGYMLMHEKAEKTFQQSLEKTPPKKPKLTS